MYDDKMYFKWHREMKFVLLTKLIIIIIIIIIIIKPKVLTFG